MTTTLRGPRRARRRSAAIGILLAAALGVGATVPSFAQDGDDIPFPTELLGEELSVRTFSGPEFLAQFTDGEAEDLTFVEGTEGLVEGVAATIDDLTVRSTLYRPTTGTPVVVMAFRIDGVNAGDFAPDAVQLLLGDVVMPELLLRPVVGKWVIRVTDATMPGVYPRTVYLRDDTAWVIEGDETLIWEVLDQLPGSERSVAADEVPLVSRIPLTLDGRRRTAMFESVEPFDLPTLSQRLTDPLDEWLLDLYLESGLSPSDIVGALAWWGVEASEESIQIEGYRLPGADPELIERLRSEIILAEGTELPDGVARVEQEIGGRAVTTLDFGADVVGGLPAPQQHVFASGDAVWVVTDHAGEPEMAAEAVAALP